MPIAVCVSTVAGSQMHGIKESVLEREVPRIDLRLVLEHIEADSRHGSGSQCCQQILIADELATER